MDVGANIGVWTIELAQRFATVVAFEPDTRAFQRLHENVSTARNVQAKNYAAWSCEGHIELRTFRNSEHSTLLQYGHDVTAGPQLGTYRVGCYHIDFFSINDCDFMKIDTEGGEVDVIEGAVQTIIRTYPHLLIEVHNKANRAWLETFLPELGYNVEVIHHPHYDKRSPYYEMHLWLNATRNL